MYPIVFISAVAWFKKDSNWSHYVLPLVLVGLIIAIYHNLLYYGILPETIQPCTLGISCTTRQLDWLGFISIPFMSLAAFLLITVTALFHLKSPSKK